MRTREAGLEVEGGSLGFGRSYVFIIYVGEVKRATKRPTFYFRDGLGGLSWWGDGPLGMGRFFNFNPFLNFILKITLQEFYLQI
jgi:hypothetical protein